MKPLKSFCLRFLTFLMASLAAAFVPAAEGAVTLSPVLSGLTKPLYVTSARDNTNRRFIVEQGGVIKVLASGATTPTIYLDIVSRVLSTGSEQGLLGLAFHPQFATNARFFVNYTRKPDGATVVAEYHAFTDPAATAASESVVLVIAQPFANHNGGMIEFGPDDLLYIGMGDGGSANDPGNRAQNKDDLLGKILRIDIDHPGGGNNYSSPASNPFFGATPGRDEIYALGLRNPFRFSFDRQTGQLYVGDVGQGAIEEVDIVTIGGNYGWRVYEGTQCTNLDPTLCTPSNYVAPIAQYSHTGGRCSITGGYVYRGPAATFQAGTYVFADYCTGEIFTLPPGGTASLLLDTTLNISSFGEDEAGEMYVVGLGGTVHRLTNSVTLVSSANPAASGAPVTFTATVAGTKPTGSVGFTSDGTAISGCNAVALTGFGNSRTAKCTVSNLAAGAHSMVATYSGDAGNATSSSAPLSQVITAVAGGSNVALASAGAVASASSTYGSGFAVSSVNNNQRMGAPWASNGAWVDGTSGAWPDWVQINFGGNKTIDRVVVYSLQDNYSNPIEPTDTMTFSLYGVVDFTVQGWNGSSWIPLATVTGNNLVKRTVTFAATTTDRIRINVTNALRSYTRLAEVEAWGVAAAAARPTSTTLASSGTPAVAGSTVNFTATVAGTNPTGTVGFTSDGTAISGCSAVALTGFGNSRTAKCTVSNLAAGTHSMVATYSGDAGNLSSSNPPLAQTITLGGSPTATAGFVRTDVATHGNWKGVYGGEGFAIVGDSASYPAYAQVAATGKGDFTWAAQPDADPRALQRALSGRIAATWYGSSFNVDINLTDQATHRVAMYLIDWGTTSRITRVEVLDAGTRQVLATQTISSFHDGTYVVWDLKGHVILRFTNVAGANAVLSALFFDSPAGAPTTFALSGRVSVGVTPLAGVQFAAPGGGNCPDSDSLGNYTCTVPSGWSGTVTPSLTNYAFAPPSRTYSRVAANQSGQDYAAATGIGPFSLDARNLDLLPPNTWTRLYPGPDKIFYNTGYGHIEADDPYNPTPGHTPEAHVTAGVSTLTATNYAIEIPVRSGVPLGGGFVGTPYGNGKMLYFGGGHSGYSANRVNVWSLATGRWSQSQYTPDMGSQVAGGGLAYRTPTPPGIGCKTAPFNGPGTGRYFATTGDIVAGSKIVTNVAVLNNMCPIVGLCPGQEQQTGGYGIFGNGIAVDAAIYSVDRAAHQVTMTHAATATASSVALTGGKPTCETGGTPNGSTGGRGWWEHSVNHYHFDERANAWMFVQVSGTWFYDDVNETWQRASGPHGGPDVPMLCGGSDYTALGTTFAPELNRSLAWCSTGGVFGYDYGSGAPNYTGARWVQLNQVPSSIQNPQTDVLGQAVWNSVKRKLFYFSAQTTSKYGTEVSNPVLYWFDPFAGSACTATSAYPCGTVGRLDGARPNHPQTYSIPIDPVTLALDTSSPCYTSMCQFVTASMTVDSVGSLYLVGRRAGDAQIALWKATDPTGPDEAWTILQDFQFDTHDNKGLRLLNSKPPNESEYEFSINSSAMGMLNYIPERNAFILITRSGSGNGGASTRGTGDPRGGGCYLNGVADDCFRMYAIRLE